MKNIFLIGFMGCGKSAVSRHMASKHGFEIIEMDELIEKQEGMSILQIFKEKGETYFRDLETKLLLEIQESAGKIVSCGGGVILREENVREMKRKGSIVWLTANPETILGRVKHNDNRPLLQGKKNVDAIQELLASRYPRYEAAADLAVKTDGRKVAEICDEILVRINE